MTQPSISDLLAELKSLRDLVERTMPRDGAVPRREAAKLLGVKSRKLESLIANGKIHTAEDTRLVPVSEIKRYCAPRAKRTRKPSVGVRAMRRKPVDSQSDEAWDDLTKRLSKKVRAG